LKYKEPQSTKIVQLEQELVRAEAQSLVAEAQLTNIVRVSLTYSPRPLILTIDRLDKSSKKHMIIILLPRSNALRSSVFSQSRLDASSIYLTIPPLFPGKVILHILIVRKLVLFSMMPRTTYVLGNRVSNPFRPTRPI
jgi:protein tyrosine/serine phosphatase